MNPSLDIEFALGTTQNFSPANALALARWSQLAYSETDIGDLVTGAACIVRELNNAVVIAFRGSRSIRDFICDADFPRVQTVNGSIHAGFERDISSIIAPVTKIVRDILARVDKPIFITGHSLGGALAILCARIFAAQEIPVHAVYTFGQPRVGDAKFAASYDAADAPETPGEILSIRERLGYPPLTLRDVTFRVVNQCDIVPRVPGLLCGFRNVGQKFFIASLAEILPVHPVIKNPKLWLLLLSDAFGLWNDWANKKQLALLDDHFIANYIAELKLLPA